ncbi:unnamed protein product [Ambrosiozyma monospora]|uniref:Unnamed protein product n=1 Tax=Ambrosiozyma monospora TaxID=43982 RepID=A0A9W6Z5J1_AMBMO|nr:unnamed protein product [Ambrosiozyma monospora]
MTHSSLNRVPKRPSMKHIILKYFLPSQLLISNTHTITIDLIIYLSLLIIFSPVITWIISILILCFFNVKEQYTPFLIGIPLIVDFCWVLRFINLKFKSCSFDEFQFTGLEKHQVTQENKRKRDGKTIKDDGEGEDDGCVVPGLNVLITGGSTGLGLEIVKRFLEVNNAQQLPFPMNNSVKNRFQCQCEPHLCQNIVRVNKIVILDIFESKELRKLREMHPENVIFVHADFNDSNFNANLLINSVLRRISKLESQQYLDVIIGNAGIRQFHQTMEDIDGSEMSKIYKVNFVSFVELIKVIILRHNNLNLNILKKRLHIISISSILGFVSPKRLSFYSGTKSSLINLMDSLRYELPANIILSCFAPGQLTSPMFDNVKVENSFLAPLIDHRKLSLRIIQVVDEGLNGLFVYPFYGRLVPALKCLPFGLYSFLRWFSGMDSVA